MNQITNWLSMGGYAAYIWSAYGLLAVVVSMNMLGLKRQKHKTGKILQQWLKDSERLQETKQS